MGKKLYIGNLPFSATEQVLSDLFAQCGTVESTKIVTDRETGRSKGFGFVEMSTEEEAQGAISKLNGSDCEGRTITVSEARPMVPREKRPGGFGGDRGPRGGGNRGGFGKR
jgi:RNA recognition motif-containing protein